MRDKPFNKKSDRRISLPSDVVNELLALGVTDTPSDIANAVSEITKMSLVLGTAYLRDPRDIVALEAALVDRTERLTRVQSDVLNCLTELEALAENRGQCQALRRLLS